MNLYDLRQQNKNEGDTNHTNLPQIHQNVRYLWTAIRVLVYTTILYITNFLKPYTFEIKDLVFN